MTQQFKGNHIVYIESPEAAVREMAAIGVSKGGMACMRDKAQFCCIKIKDITCKSANILKQEMLSRGGEAAVSTDTIYAEGRTDVLLMGTHLQMTYLAEKLRKQPLGLKNVADTIDEILEAQVKKAYDVPLPDGRTLTLQDGATKLMGIVNVTPDSFSDGGTSLKPEDAVAKALRLAEEGAEIIDLGAVSTRPNAELADAEEEWQRLAPVLKALQGEKFLISVDTFRADIAARALDAGAEIINDIGGFRMDEKLASVVAEAGCPIIMMHNRLQVHPEPYTDFLSDVVKDLEESRAIGYAAGVKPEQIIIDPGIGFGKTAAENRLLIKELKIFKALGHPLLLGLSRKSFIADTFPETEAKDRDDASVIAGMVGCLNGAHILRVHEVKKTAAALKMLDAIRGELGGNA